MKKRKANTKHMLQNEDGQILTLIKDTKYKTQIVGDDALVYDKYDQSRVFRCASFLFDNQE